MIKRGNLSKRGQIKGKKAQMQISFGMIFSIILVIAFLAFAFYAIKVFLKTGDSAKAAKFINDLQGDMTDVWNSAGGAGTREYLVPGYADFVCFIDFDSGAEGVNDVLYPELESTNSGGENSENFAFYPVEFNGFEAANLEHIDMEKTTENENPLCIQAKNGKVSLILKKDSGEALVTVERAG